MGELEQEKTLAEVDRAEREALRRAKTAILRVYEAADPASLPALVQALEDSDADALSDRSLLRLALLSLLNNGQLSFADERQAAATG